MAITVHNHYGVRYTTYVVSLHRRMRKGDVPRKHPIGRWCPICGFSGSERSEYYYQRAIALARRVGTLPQKRQTLTKID